MFSFHKPKIYRSISGCCICKAKSSSSRFTDSKKYESEFEKCFRINEKRSGEICNACVLLVKRWKKLPPGTMRDWRHVVDARAGPGTKSFKNGKNNLNSANQISTTSTSQVHRRHYKSKQSRPKRATNADNENADLKNTSIKLNQIPNVNASDSSEAEDDDDDVIEEEEEENEDVEDDDYLSEDYDDTPTSKRKTNRITSNCSSKSAITRKSIKSIKRIIGNSSNTSNNLSNDIGSANNISNTTNNSSSNVSKISSFLDMSFWRKEKICCGIIFKGPDNEVLIYPKLLKPCICRQSAMKLASNSSSTGSDTGSVTSNSPVEDDANSNASGNLFLI